VQYVGMQAEKALPTSLFSLLFFVLII